MPLGTPLPLASRNAEQLRAMKILYSANRILQAAALEHANRIPRD